MCEREEKVKEATDNIPEQKKIPRWKSKKQDLLAELEESQIIIKELEYINLALAKKQERKSQEQPSLV